MAECILILLLSAAKKAAKNRSLAFVIWSKPRKISTYAINQSPDNLRPMGAGSECCEIVGYISHHKGITIHQSDCENIIHLTRQQQTQLVSVSWDIEVDQ